MYCEALWALLVQTAAKSLVRCIFLDSLGVPVAEVEDEADAIHEAKNLLSPYFRIGDKSEIAGRDVVLLKMKRVGLDIWQKFSLAISSSFSPWRIDRAGDPIFLLQTGTLMRLLHVSANYSQAVEFSPGQVQIFYPLGDTVQSAKRLSRVIRVIFTQQRQATGAALLHASTVADCDGAIAFIGAKGAGKTTAMLFALQRGLRFVTNDQLLLSSSGHAFGLPISANIRPSNLLLGKELQGKVVSPLNIAEHFETSITPHAPLHAMILLQRSRKAGSNTLRRVLHERAIELLCEHLIAEPSPQQPYWNFLEIPFQNRLPSPIGRVPTFIASHQGGDIGWIFDKLCQTESQ